MKIKILWNVLIYIGKEKIISQQLRTQKESKQLEILICFRPIYPVFYINPFEIGPHQKVCSLLPPTWTQSRVLTFGILLKHKGLS